MRVTYFLIVLGITILYVVYRRTGLIAKKDAADLLRKGALVIDVRTPAEFYSGHLSQAYNMPLDEVENLVVNKVRDRGKVLLLHCQSGFRARTAQRRLASMGYKNVFVLGSYERAFRIVSSKTL